MPISPDFEVRTGFTTIRQMLRGLCLGEPGRAEVDRMVFNADFASLEPELRLTAEFRDALATVFGYPSGEYFLLEFELASALIPGSLLPPEVLVLLASSYSLFIQSIEYLQRLPADRYPKIKGLISGKEALPEVVALINRVIEPDGRIRDNASPELLSIRKALAQMGGQIEKRMQSSLRKAKDDKLVAADAEAVIRNGQVVIPIASSHKRKLQGVIMDESATGQTSYIQPIEVFELMNRSRELELAERREITRILTALADELRPTLPTVMEGLRFLGRLDFLRAKALFALETRAQLPHLNDAPAFNWLQARHPLLMLALRKQNREVVPADIGLNDQQRILVISGPNAGGKSVSLKTTGLLQYMLQCGMLIPVLDTSEAGIFDNMFIEIGDQQSIENDLSTYTGHLTHLKSLLESAGEKTLFLIDEFGSGTEPHSGGAIAAAILEHLNQAKARGIVTTHYANLKQMAFEHEGLTNAAMLYDTKKMHPLYVLATGKPGSSFAFEIASSIPLPANVIQLAMEKAGNQSIDYDRQIQQLEAEKLALEQKEKQLRQADDTLSALINRFTDKEKMLDQTKRDILDSARQEAKNIVAGANKLIENTVREIKQAQADNAVAKAAREKVKEFSEELSQPGAHPETLSEAEPEEPVISSFTNGPIAIGSLVTVQGQHQAGEVLSIKDGTATVAFNSVKMKLPLESLQTATAAQSITGTANRGIHYQNMMNDMNARMSNFRLTLDVRGKRAEETFGIIQKYIDEANMLRVHEVGILHGKGNGVLRNVVRNYLASLPFVKSYRDAPLESGGAGITLVSIS